MSLFASARFGSVFGRLTPLCFSLLLSVGMMTTAAQAVTLTSSEETVAVGDTFTVSLNLEISDQLGTTTALFGYDPAAAQFLSISKGTAFDGAIFLDLPPIIAPGLIQQQVFFLIDAFGPASLLELSFKALTTGFANFTASGAVFNSNPSFFDSYSLSAQVALEGQPTASPIPLPASGVLLFFAGLSLLRLRRRGA